MWLQQSPAPSSSSSSSRDVSRDPAAAAAAVTDSPAWRRVLYSLSIGQHGRRYHRNSQQWWWWRWRHWLQLPSLIPACTVWGGGGGGVEMTPRHLFLMLELIGNLRLFLKRICVQRKITKKYRFDLFENVGDLPVSSKWWVSINEVSRSVGQWQTNSINLKTSYLL